MQRLHELELRLIAAIESSASSALPGRLLEGHIARRRLSHAAAVAQGVGISVQRNKTSSREAKSSASRGTFCAPARNARAVDVGFLAGRHRGYEDSWDWLQNASRRASRPRDAADGLER